MWKHFGRWLANDWGWRPIYSDPLFGWTMGQKPGRYREACRRVSLNGKMPVGVVQWWEPMVHRWEFGRECGEEEWNSLEGKNLV